MTCSCTACNLDGVAALTRTYVDGSTERHSRGSCVRTDTDGAITHLGLRDINTRLEDAIDEIVDRPDGGESQHGPQWQESVLEFYVTGGSEEQLGERALKMIGEFVADPGDWNYSIRYSPYLVTASDGVVIWRADVKAWCP